MRIGLDFGTTNSGAAAFDGHELHLFALEPASPDPTVIRSTLYITRDHEITIGREAVDTYYRQNIGRPSKMVRQRIGEIELTLSDVGSVKGYPVEMTTVVRDVFALVDELTPGRLLHSLKSGLTTGQQPTTIFGRTYQLEQLIAQYLRQIKRRVEKEAGQTIQAVVIGRPVNFVDSSGEADNRRAEDRLRNAAQEAGFREVSFELEPVAAALYYELSVRESQNIVVFDLGGGTVDITVMRVGGSAQRKVFATGGVGVAGDTFDRRIIGGLVLDHFGRGSTWGERATPFPQQYTQALLHWQTVLELNKPETLHFLRQARRTSSHPEQVAALESLVVNNYAIRLFEEVERAKIALSSDCVDRIQLTGEDIDLWQPVTRSQFESLIATDADRIEGCLADTLVRSGLTADEIDAVVRTGGSAQIPCIESLLERIFGREKVILSSVFGGVTAGLAVRAWMSESPGPAPDPGR